MKEYHKINSPFKRDDRGKFLVGEWAQPEFEYLQDNLWSWTEKIDGTNIRIIWQQYNEGLAITQSYGGKTDNAQIPTKLLGWLQDNIRPTQGELREIFRVRDIETFPQVCLYGEGYGAGIQKGGGNYSAEQKFILFDVKIGDFWLSRDNVLDIADKLNLDVVKLYGTNTLNDMIDVVSTDSFYESAFDTLPDQRPEGYVGTPVISLFTRKGERIITKIKFKDFGVK